MKRLLVGFVLAFSAAGCKDASEWNESPLPSAAHSVERLGGGWTAFRMVVAGRERSFLYHSNKYVDGAVVNPTETLTELNP